MLKLSMYCICFLILLININTNAGNECLQDNSCKQSYNKYSKEINELSAMISQNIKNATENYKPCDNKNCGCYKDVIDQDFEPFKDGITKEQFELARSKGTKYQIIDGKLYREKECHFPARCSGIEHYLKAICGKLPNLEIAINTRDWPQVNKAWGHQKAPVLSFSKTREHYDIMFPAWSFWEGGPAIALYPAGLGRWARHRDALAAAAQQWPWEKKEAKGFFRGSRTSADRDAFVLLSRAEPALLDARYTRNQAWRSDADTLGAAPAPEVPPEEHCRYRVLLSARGVAASFRLRHLLLCRALVLHAAGAAPWLEFFYPALRPWLHYVPVPAPPTPDSIRALLLYFREHDARARDIAERGYRHVWDNLTDEDVRCYWRRLLRRYSKLLKYEVVRDPDLVPV